jgi:NapH/MauN family ferredoxin-type protein
VKIFSSKTKVFQFIFKLGILIFITYIAIAHQLQGVMGAPPIHSFCPFGGLASLFKLVSQGSYIHKIFPATMVLFGSTVVMAILFGRGFCGWICPLGLLQEFFTYIGRKLRINQNRMPAGLDSKFKYIKYVGLVVIIYFSWRTGSLVFNNYDPWAAYAHIPEGFGELYDEFLVGTIFLVVGMVGSLWVPQNWCRYFCPMGAFLGILSKISPTRIVRDSDACINCDLCSKVCPVALDVSHGEVVSKSECYQCGDCLAVCPVDGALQLKIIKRKRIAPIVYGLIIIVLFFGSIYGAKALKVWRVGFSSIHEAVTNEDGERDPVLIKGSMTLNQIEAEFNIPASLIKKRLELPESVSGDMFLKKIAHEYNVGVDNIRAVVIEILMERKRDEQSPD